MDLNVDGLFKDNMCNLAPLGRAIAQLDGSTSTVEIVEKELAVVLELMEAQPDSTNGTVREAPISFGFSQQELARTRILEALEAAYQKRCFPHPNLQFAWARLQYFPPNEQLSLPTTESD